MTTDGFRTPRPPDVLLSAYDLAPGTGSDNTGAGGSDSAVTGGCPAQHVTGLVVLDGLACATRVLSLADHGSSGELHIADSAAATAPRRVPLRPAPVGLAAVSTDAGGRLFLLAPDAGTVVPIDVRRDGDPSHPGAAIRLGPPPDASSRARASRRERLEPAITASSALRRVYVSDPVSGRILVIDADRLLPLPDEAIELPAAPRRLIVDEQDSTLLALLAGCGGTELAVVDPIIGTVETLALAAGVDPRDIIYDNASGLIFVGTGATGSIPAGVLVLDRDTGCAVGAPIRTAGAPTALSLLRVAGTTLLFCATTAISTALAGVPDSLVAASDDRVEVVDVAHRAVVGSVRVPAGSGVMAVDQQAGNVFVAGTATGRITRLAPRVGGTPIARHPAIECSGAGAALGGPRRTPDGTGWLQPFRRGTAVATADTGAVLIDADHADAWLASETRPGTPDAEPGELDVAAGADTDRDNRLGNPVADTMSLTGRRVTFFERGLVATGPVPGEPVVVGGPVYLRYRELDDIAGPLGPPTASVIGGPGGALLQSFAHGHIVHHPESGTHVLQGTGPQSLGRGCPERCKRSGLDVVGSPSSGATRSNSATVLLTGEAEVVQVTDEGGHLLRVPAALRPTESTLPTVPRLPTVPAVPTMTAVPTVPVASHPPPPTGALGAAGCRPLGIPGLMSLARLPRLGALPGGELFSAAGEHAGLRFEVRAGAGGPDSTDAGTVAHQASGRATGTDRAAPADVVGEYCWSVWMAGCAARVTAAATAVPDRLTAEHIGTPSRGVSVEVPRNGTAKRFAITIQAAGSAHPRLPRIRRYVIDELIIVAGQRISLRIDDGGAQLVATNHGPTATLVMRIGADHHGRAPAPRRAVLAAGATTVFRPLDWTVDGTSSQAVSVEVRDTPNGPARVCGELWSVG